MLEEDVVEEYSIVWLSPVLLAAKKDGFTRICVDYRKLKDITKNNSFLLPRKDDRLDDLSGSEWFSASDMESDYWQVALLAEDKEKTAFSAGNGLNQLKVSKDYAF